MLPTKNHSHIEFMNAFTFADLVCYYRIVSEGGSEVVHLAVVKLDGTAPSFYELMSAKNFLWPHSQAVQIYPPASEVVDDGGNSATHLWILSGSEKLPHTLLNRNRGVTHGLS